MCTFILNPELPATPTAKMKDILNNPANCRKLNIELAVTVDSMDPFVRATYYLEGDGPLSLSAYECVQSQYAILVLEIAWVDINFNNLNLDIVQKLSEQSPYGYFQLDAARKKMFVEMCGDVWLPQ